MIHSGDGSVSCWGSNASGQAGQPTSANGNCSESSGMTVPCLVSPAQVAGVTNASQIVAGEEYTCILKSDMTVACWGDNSEGQLGDGTNTSRPAVAAVKNLASDIVELSGGRFFVCARHQSGSISCWGGGTNGQLGNGKTDNSTSPVSVAGVTDALQLAAGLRHTCALRGGSRVSCWGGNSDGQLGNGTTTDSLVPVDVIDLKQVNSIAAGSVFTCARAPTGAAFCWGEDLVNELGDGAVTNQSQPVSVAGFSSM
jgi:alpha-tubulin suppressor-like RCC1 family protein